ncbi:hypothetical protein E0H85_03590 [Acinetobacter terrae]|uniref:Uncharacterized protein n=1 Tax=Acinetobacter terrae TaxID=2731247 RepID=A0A4R0EQJ2_9GAMM|nr:hypothetical protein E0H85_03590 [Acinetobacter terrae]
MKLLSLLKKPKIGSSIQYQIKPLKAITQIPNTRALCPAFICTTINPDKKNIRIKDETLYFCHHACRQGFRAVTEVLL